MATTMTTREIVKTIRNLPAKSRQKVLKALQEDQPEPATPAISEDEVNRILFERGVIGNLPDLSQYTDEDDDFEPIKIKGKPLSETIIEERR